MLFKEVNLKQMLKGSIVNGRWSMVKGFNLSFTDGMNGVMSESRRNEQVGLCCL